MELFAALVSITIIDLVLSGDNAVIIALASRNLPRDQRNKAVIWGTAGAVGLRVFLTFVATMLLQIPYMQTIGGIALLYIAIKLLADEKKEIHCEEANSFWGAIKTIMVADAIMSLDNVLAVAGVANGHYLLLTFGLALSIPLVVFGSQMLMKLMDKFPWITYIGAGILGWSAAKMIVHSPVGSINLEPYALTIEVGLTVAVIAIGYLLKHRNSEVEPKPATDYQG